MLNKLYIFQVMMIKMILFIYNNFKNKLKLIN